MNNINSSMLEGMISILVNEKFKDIPPTENEFNQCADAVREANKGLMPVTDEEFDNLKLRLRQNTIVTLDTGICLPDPSNNHQLWLASRKADIDFFFWERYKTYLEQVKHWNPRHISSLSKDSDEILDQCGNPQENSFHIRGLVLGDVQSGKTANYTAIANKAADAGYDLIIVLAGIPEILRQQTQIRLDEELCGRQSNLYLDPNATAKFVPVGVGKYGTRKSIASFTSEANDFNAAVLKSNNLALDNVNCTILLVVKKNKTILNNLYKWLKNNNVLTNNQIQKSLLLIDDEADNASINTHDPEEDPTAINSAIRELLLLFSKTSYLAITATPFANIFIDPFNNEDLFPSDFIYVLDDPTDYVGAEKIFSDLGPNKGMVENIDVDKFECVFADKHKKDLVVETLPDDLFDAANYFLIVNGIRDLRGDNNCHRSMMVHVSRFINVQKQIAEIINTWLDQVKSDLRNYSRESIEKTEKIQSISKLHKIWDKYSCEALSKVTWETFLHDYLYRAVAPIDVRSVNSAKNSSSLDYDNHKPDGLRVIAVGGNTLSRGLTLEGLVVSYFYRTTNMYDTLMQMGRWFGYRQNYEDLVKIWLSSEMSTSYGHIYDATQDLKDQIARMKLAKLSPHEFGLKVMRDPDALLIVTARNKMRSSEPLVCPVSVSKKLLETPRLYNDKEVLSQNADAILKFIKGLSTQGERVYTTEKYTGGNYYWQNVQGDYIAELLRNFKTHPWHFSYNGFALADYISKQHWTGNWDVVLMNNGDGDPYLERPIVCGDEILKIEHTEKRTIFINKDRLLINEKLRVGSGGCAKIGLTHSQITAAENDYRLANPGKRTYNYPDSAYLIKDRQPILMVHILFKGEIQPADALCPDFLFGIGVGFPDDDQENRTIDYQVNRIEYNNWFGGDEDGSEE